MAEQQAAFQAQVLPARDDGPGIGVATLTAPRKLNALDLGMIQALSRQLEAWARDPAVACVVLEGEGERAFCAGGDVRAVAEALRGNRPAGLAFAEQYFSAEYRLDHQLHVYPKPLLVRGQGVVMGGGLGLFQGGDVRVLTPTSTLAMPEITIGLFPDVGAAWFLQRTPPGTGEYAALTGARLNAADALFMGLGDLVLPEDHRGALLEALQAVRWHNEPRRDRSLLHQAARGLAIPRPELSDSPVQARAERIRQVMAWPGLGQRVAAIRDSARHDPWLEENAERFESGSPTSIALIHEQFQRTRHLALRECFQLDLVLAIQCSRRDDFPEGVRALLLDKDQNPQWQSATLREITPDWIDAHFVSPWPDQPNPLLDL
ncbi:enoyl-CoA hydratase/isomerase family protein [Alkalilimnicola ehrlichii MLHE-1]|uniref:3-hydroxyisobutyryl-CoA hydrolase n=1 Tax=Alkalilimnicola ehrlichii (strain ATCC BAA-1101 / DSM 17681 / MLHE-1) TaxID=187272 RepID=Q0A896_ALKEH|nr:enoyl-CoA hydratase/isomerase family protein [Alkalilimnicola ehrlichii]ABI56941.1 Enoyl-CoA hydratase/isomerase [Alkalilimnicola ehrlichii MLHE-1]